MCAALRPRTSGDGSSRSACSAAMSWRSAQLTVLTPSAPHTKSHSASGVVSNPYAHVNRFCASWEQQCSQYIARSGFRIVSTP